MAAQDMTAGLRERDNQVNPEFFFYNLTWKKRSIARPCPILSNRSKSPNLAYTQGEEITQGVSALRALRAVSAAKGGQR